MTLLLVTNFLSCLGIFISLPVITLVLQERFGLPASSIGIISSIWPASVFASSIFCGPLMDRLGYRSCILHGLAVSSLSFFIIAFTRNVYCFAAAMAMFGIGKAFFDASIKVAVSALSEVDNRSKAFRVRYIVLNLASVLGPLIGACLFPIISQGVFICSSLTYTLAWMFSTCSLKKTYPYNSQLNSPAPISSYRLLLQDRALLLWSLSSILILMVYGAFEALMPLVAKRNFGGIPVLGFLLSLNAAVVIGMQLLPFVHVTFEREGALAKLGFAGLIAGFSTFAIFHSSIAGLILGTILFSAGEALLFPCFDTLLDHLAPESSKTSYFAIGEVKQVGFLLGPLVGGFIYEVNGGFALFGSLSLFCTLSLFMFLQSRARVAS